MALPKNMKFNSFLPPALVYPASGKTYVCPGWIEVPSDTTLEEVYSHWIQHQPPQEKKPTALISETVMSSSGKGSYLVEFDGMYWNCTCPGFGFRQTCRHLEKIKEKYT